MAGRVAASWTAALWAAGAALLPLSATAEGPVPAEAPACSTQGSPSCVDVVADAIDAARSTVRIQGSGFWSQPELRALAVATARGVDVQAIVKEVPGISPATGLGAAQLANAGVTVWLDSPPAGPGAKMVILDASTVIIMHTMVRVPDERVPSKANMFEVIESATPVQDAAAVAAHSRAWEARRAVSRAFGAE